MPGHIDCSWGSCFAPEVLLSLQISQLHILCIYIYNIIYILIYKDDMQILYIHTNTYTYHVYIIYVYNTHVWFIRLDCFAQRVNGRMAMTKSWLAGNSEFIWWPNTSYFFAFQTFLLQIRVVTKQVVSLKNYHLGVWRILQVKHGRAPNSSSELFL